MCRIGRHASRISGIGFARSEIPPAPRLPSSEAAYHRGHSHSVIGSLHVVPGELSAPHMKTIEECHEHLVAGVRGSEAIGTLGEEPLLGRLVGRVSFWRRFFR